MMPSSFASGKQLNYTIMNSSVQEKVVRDQSTDLLTNEELTIKVASSHFQDSPMSAEQKMDARKDAPSLYAIFESTLKSKGEYDLDQIKWNSDDELEMKYLSNNALHSFVLEAEKLGKKISYEKVLRVKVSN